ncbi:hypothetical protein GSI_15652 [Ganoderma sinense ZZ0214-1]|uniref:Uncharacterized protein n=1 Tax=Ganoderma sinense ZZ0214-1 TaxID=1077348 RepID=A0A2G8RN60_9APHY|nr:hypothetical protein GSI_15652 [Ganoderma sinense ZZ0214-1]
MPALLLPAATAVHLWLDVDADAPPSDALLPHPVYWRDATRLRAEEGSYGGISIELEGPSSPPHPHPHPHPQRQRVSLYLEYTAADDWDGHPLWPLPVPSLATLSSVAAAHLSLFGGWRAALPRFVARLPALAALAVEGCMADPACAAEMVSVLRDALWYHNPNRDRDREGANEGDGGAGGCRGCGSSRWKRKRDGLQLERLRTWIAPECRDTSPGHGMGAGEAQAAGAHAVNRKGGDRDVGDGLAEYVGAGTVEHEDGPFWPRDEEVWRRENEFWEVPRTWWHIPVSKEALDSIGRDVELTYALLARRYNSQVPVNRLPPELLGMVFERLREPARVFNPEVVLRTPLFDPFEPLVSAMMVCNKWYIVALERASLWTEVDYSCGLDDPSCPLEMSRMAPIYLRIELSEEWEEEFLALIRLNAARLRQLDLWTWDQGSLGNASRLLDFDTPLLRCLRISEKYPSETVTHVGSLGNHPSLRGMVLSRCIWIPSGGVQPLTALTHLLVSSFPSVSVDEFVMLLDATPALEVLELDGCDDLYLRSIPTHTTTLAHLTHLTICRMSTEVAAVFMPALFLPNATSVCLSLDVDWDTPITDAVLPQPPFWQRATHVHVDDEEYESLSVELSDDTHRLALLLLNYDMQDDRASWPLPVPSPATLPHVSAAHLCLCDWQLLRTIAPCVPALATLYVETYEEYEDEADAERMVEALRDVLLQEDPVLCPNLTEVALISSWKVPGLTQHLAPALRKRKRDGRQVERLRTWIRVDEDGKLDPEIVVGDIGDALAEYVGAGKVEHEEGAFWRPDEERWRRENEFWVVPSKWSS